MLRHEYDLRQDSNVYPILQLLKTHLTAAKQA